MTWQPDDALVEKAARAICEADGIDPDGYGFNPRFRYWREKRDEARAALIAAYPDMVAEAVKAEAEACAATLDAMAESHQRAADAIADQGHMEVALGFRGASASASECAALIRARHP